jgi:hypothetical protein
MTEPTHESAAAAPASEPPNPFLAPDSACDPSQSADAERDSDGIAAPPDWFATPSLTAAPLHRRGSGRARRQRCGYHLVAAAAVAVVTAMLLGLAIDQPAGPAPRPAGRVPPSTLAPALPEPPGTRHRPRAAKARKSPRAPTARARPRLRPAAHTAARRRATRRRRMATHQRPSSASPATSPIPSPAPHRAPAPTRVMPRAPALPMPVPSSAPPEFM